MTEFKVGDKVRRKPEYRYRNCKAWIWADKVVVVVGVSRRSIDLGDEYYGMWDACRFDLVSEKENDVNNEVEKQVPGVPDGYRLVRIGVPKKGETYVIHQGSVQEASGDWHPANTSIAIVEPIEPPEPKTEDVVLNKYLVWSGGHWQLVVSTAEYADMHFTRYKLIGHSETVEMEVGV